ncbi:MAG: hypothetical protein V4548_05730 [Bacteroidota bacterium]
MNKLKLVIFLLGSLLIVNCSDNEAEFDPNSVDFTLNYGGPAIRDFIGQVVDESNNALVGATIKIGSVTVQTDVNGVFVIKAASVNTQFGYITAEKAGYIDGSRAVVPTDGITNVRIMLFSDTTTATVSAGAPSEVSLANGAKVNFKGTFKDESDVAYTGAVKVTLHFIDSGDDNLTVKMPGMLYGASSLVKPRNLKTYGMLSVDLKGAAGQKLKIASKATVKIPINSTQLTTAPSSLSLWSFDEVKGYWNQEGDASIQSGSYVGTVKDVSFVNSATDFQVIAFRQSFLNSNGDKLANVNIGILRAGEIFPIIKTTNRDGQIGSVVPANEVLTLNVYDNCGNIIKTAQVGPFTINTTSTSMTIGSDILPSTAIKGNLFKCDNTPVTSGYVLIKSNNQTKLSSVPVTGVLNLNTLVCTSGTSFSLKAGDFDNSQTTDYINYTHTAPTTTIGNLKPCNTITEFISYKIDNGAVKYIVDTFNVNISGPSVAISGSNTISGLNMDIYGNAATAGIYTSNQFTIDNVDVGGTIDNTSSSTVSFNISQIGASVGQYVDMTFVGTYMTGATTHTITGVAHVKRD